MYYPKEFLEELGTKFGFNYKDELIEYAIRVGLVNVDDRTQRIKDEIQSAAKLAGIEPTLLLSKSRVREVRQIMMKYIRDKYGLGFREIGMFFGGRDHSTVIHACNICLDFEQINEPMYMNLKKVLSPILKSKQNHINHFESAAML